jgi:hypothetical protein
MKMYRKIIRPTPTLAVIIPAFISLRRLVSGVVSLCRSRSFSFRTHWSLDCSISATHVLLQSNLPGTVPAVTEARTISRLAPQVLQNLNSSLCVDPHCGQYIGFSEYYLEIREMLARCSSICETNRFGSLDPAVFFSKTMSIKRQKPDCFSEMSKGERKHGQNSL